MAYDVSTTGVAFDVERVRADFPILRRTVHGKHFAYLDNAATAQKPQVVIDTMNDYYRDLNANVHRGVHLLSEQASDKYEESRRKVQRWLNAAREEEIVFTAGTTAAINLVAHSFARPRLAAGDEIVVTTMEHHANIVPWQLACEERGARLVEATISDAGELDMDAFRRCLTPRTRLVAVTHVSNALGTINPVKELVRIAHEHGIPALVDGAQAAPHMRVDVRDIDADFYVFSGHKLFGPTGIGILYGKYAHLDAMPPYQGGGHMINEVRIERTTYNIVPARFEAGTPPIAEVIGLGAAIDYLETLDWRAIPAYEKELHDHGMEALREIEGLRVIGTARHKAGVISFVFEDIHPHDVGTIVDREGVAVRVGHHCAQLVMRRFNVPSTARASFAFYNTHAEVDQLAAALRTVISMFR